MRVFGGGFGAVEVILQHRFVVGMRAFVDDDLGALFRRQAADVGYAALGDEYVDVVFGVVDMRAHRHDRGNVAFLRGRGREEERQFAVAGEVAGTADAVHHLAAHDVRGIDVSIDIHFNRSVHGNNAKTPGQFGIVGDTLRTQHDLFPVFGNIGIEAFQSIR